MQVILLFIIPLLVSSLRLLATGADDLAEDKTQSNVLLMSTTIASQFSGADTTMPTDLLMLDAGTCKMSLFNDTASMPSFLYFPHAYDVPLNLLFSDPDSVKGYDLLPRTAQGDKKMYGLPNANGPYYSLQNVDLENHLKMIDCETSRNQLVQRIGPFSSVGGWGFWSLQAPIIHAGHAGRIPNGSSVTGASFHIVDHDGNVLPLPPIYMHHFFMGEHVLQNFARPQLMEAIYFQGGDHQCLDFEGGLRCQGFEAKEGHGFPIGSQMETIAHINDVRPKDSDVLHWWWHLELRWAVQRVVPLSYLIIGNPSQEVGLQYKAPTNAENFFWWTYRMPRDGHTTTISVHSHRAVSLHAFLFFATPVQLGLDKIDRFPKSPADPILLAKSGFESLNQLRQKILENLDRSVQKTLSDCRTDCEFVRRPRVICDVPQKQEEVEGLLYDRAIPPSRQCEQFSFRANDTVTALFFNGVLDRRSLDPLLVIDRQRVPQFFLQHANWKLTYVATDGTSQNRNVSPSRNVE